MYVAATICGAGAADYVVGAIIYGKRDSAGCDSNCGMIPRARCGGGCECYSGSTDLGAAA